jgi:hypothetical protein
MLECSKQMAHKCFPPEPEFLNLLRSPGNDSQPGEIDSLESIPGLLKRLQIRSQGPNYKESMDADTFSAVILYFRIRPQEYSMSSYVYVHCTITNFAYII